jgi:adenosylhomocysteine nucleosidase
MKKEILLCVAFPDENMNEALSELGCDLIYTGVGKVNAALNLAKRLSLHNSSNLAVINLGSAGSHVFSSGQVVCTSRFFERDMDVTPLGFPLGLTPFEDELYIESSLVFPGIPSAICYTGDSFVKERNPETKYEILDMEGYALAKVCKSFGVQFGAIKFITDGADGDAAEEWKKSVPRTAEALKNTLLQAIQNI